MITCRRVSRSLLALTALLCTNTYAQTTAPANPLQVLPGLKLDPMPTASTGEWHRANSTHRQALFPQTTDDGRYWLQLNAPNARSVQVAIGNRRYAYERDANGTWNVIIPYQGPGMKYVAVYVDGVQMQEPGTDINYSNGWKSALESPAPGEDYYAVNEVPHGDVREHWFKSTVTGNYRRMFVYTPPGYDDSTTRYPVLYLQHGAGEMEQEWTHSGFANFILDNLLAEKKAVPMIVVMNNGFANRPGEPPAGLRLPGRGAGAATAPAARGPGNTSQITAFEEVLIKEVIPDVDAHFRTIADRDHRAMAGLSMGGGQTFQIGLRHLDTFAYLGMFSAPLGNIATLPDPLNDPASFNQRVHAFWFSAGTTGSDLAIHDNAKAFVEKATQAGVHATFFESPDTQHEWQTWRRSLHAFAPLLFKQ